MFVYEYIQWRYKTVFEHRTDLITIRVTKDNVIKYQSFFCEGLDLFDYIYYMGAPWTSALILSRFRVDLHSE